MCLDFGTRYSMIAGIYNLSLFDTGFYDQVST